ncbi:Synaptic vesicle glycoprotein 2C [Varanus komodoensis]|nr:Synaptic vesicle glycoprotein 2C [Varanus komodoensis]
MATRRTSVTGWSFSMGSAYQFHSWRVFVVMCALPCVSAVVALTFMPESPRFLLEAGKHDEAWMILKQIHDTNMRARGQPEKVFTVNRIKTPKQIDELIEIESDTGTWYRRCYVRVRTELDGIWLTFMRCFTYPVKDNTTKLAAVWFTLSFGYYGLSVWFPDVIKQLQADEYASRRKNFYNQTIADFEFNFTLENQMHFNGTFLNDRFTMMKFKTVTFQDTLFENCNFEDVTTLNTYFRNCTFLNTTFRNTDIEPSKCPGSEFINPRFFHNKTGCQISFDDDYSAYWIYFVNFLGTLAVLPGNIVSALLMDRIGRLTMLGGSMILSGISCFFLWFGTSESMMIGMLCLYNGLTISAWNSLDVITVELYPTDRSLKFPQNSETWTCSFVYSSPNTSMGGVQPAEDEFGFRVLGVGRSRPSFIAWRSSWIHFCHLRPRWPTKLLPGQRESGLCKLHSGNLQASVNSTWASPCQLISCQSSACEKCGPQHNNLDQEAWKYKTSSNLLASAASIHPRPMQRVGFNLSWLGVIILGVALSSAVYLEDSEGRKGGSILTSAHGIAVISLLLLLGGKDLSRKPSMHFYRLLPDRRLVFSIQETAHSKSPPSHPLSTSSPQAGGRLGPMDVFEKQQKATGFGFLNALCKAAAVLGNLIFGSFVVLAISIPILLASTVLVCGGLVGLRLPDTRTQVLISPIGNGVYPRSLCSRVRYVAITSAAPTPKSVAVTAAAFFLWSSLWPEHKHSSAFLPEFGAFQALKQKETFPFTLIPSRQDPLRDKSTQQLSYSFACCPFWVVEEGKKEESRLKLTWAGKMYPITVINNNPLNYITNQ